jgi:hypothetical protein
MSKLLESILNEDYVSANELFEERMVKLQEQKLYEEKRMIASEMNEAVGALTAKEIADRRARGFVKASEVLRDPRDIKITLNKNVKKTKKKKVSEESLDEAGLAPTKTGKFYRTGLKTGRAIGGAIGSLRQKIRTSREVIQNYKDEKAKEAQSSFPQGMHDTQSSSVKERPGIIRRNVNTLMGRKANYVKPETSADEKGGRGGKVLRKAGKVLGFAGRVASTMLQSAE